MIHYTQVETGCIKEPLRPLQCVWFDDLAHRLPAWIGQVFGQADDFHAGVHPDKPWAYFPMLAKCIMRQL